MRVWQSSKRQTFIQHCIFQSLWVTKSRLLSFLPLCLKSSRVSRERGCERHVEQGWTWTKKPPFYHKDLERRQTTHTFAQGQRQEMNKESPEDNGAAVGDQGNRGEAGGAEACRRNKELFSGAEGQPWQHQTVPLICYWYLLRKITNSHSMLIYIKYTVYITKRDTIGLSQVTDTKLCEKEICLKYYSNVRESETLDMAWNDKQSDLCAPWQNVSLKCFSSF